MTLALPALNAQTYSPPTNGDYGGLGPFSVSVQTFTNSTYPTTSNGTNLVVSVFYPGATINSALPTIFFAHGYTDPAGNASDYGDLLTNLASQGYNVVFSPYEGGVIPPTIAKRFDELTSGFDEAVSRFGLNTNQVGFAGHSYGGGFLPAVIQHEMMGLADQFSAGHAWGRTAAFFYSMAPGYAYDGGGQTGVSSTQTIYFPTNLNVIEEVFNDDTTIADPRLAIDIFYNCTTLNAQKDFSTVYGDSHGKPPQVANHFLPTSGSDVTSTSLRAWGIFRHIDALAAWTFSGDTTARQIALGNGAATETDEGVWSDGTNVAPLSESDIPNPTNYFSGSYVVQWSAAANPRGNFPLVNGPPRFGNIVMASNEIILTATNLLSAHSYMEQGSSNLLSNSWSNLVNFSPIQTTQMFTNTLTPSSNQFWRILAP